MDSKELYKGSEKKSNLEDIIEKVKFPISQLRGSINTIATNARRKIANEFGVKEFGIDRSTAEMTFNCKKSDYEGLQCGYDIIIHIYNRNKENDVMDCYSYSIPLQDKISNNILCTHYSSKSTFELFDPAQSSRLIKGIEDSVVGIIHAYNPKALTDIDKQGILIGAVVSTYLQPMEGNTEISGNDNGLVYIGEGTTANFVYLPYKSRP